MESIPCIFGHGYSGQVAITENGFTGLRCPKCPTVYISPRPEPEAVFDLYHHDKAYLPAGFHTGYNPGARLQAQRHFSAIYDHSPFRINGEKPKSILEIGCGGGHLLRIAKERGLDSYGVELNPYQAKYVSDSFAISCETVPFTTKSFGDKKFDVIFHCDVISHFHDPIADLSAMHEKLTPGGYLVFETGNIGDVDPKYLKYFQAFQYPDHLFFFGEDSIRDLVRRTGYSDVKIASWSILPQLALWKFLRRKRKAPSNSNGGNTSNAPKPTRLPNLNFRQKVLRFAAAHTLTSVRYGLGSMLSNPRHPRTMLVWAKK